MSPDEAKEVIELSLSILEKEYGIDLQDGESKSVVKKMIRPGIHQITFYSSGY